LFGISYLNGFLAFSNYLPEGFEKPGLLVKIKAREILKPQHINHM